MDFTAFMRIERDASHGRHVIVHLADPKFAMELELDGDAPDGRGRGVIKRLCVPNSWAGDYGRYAKAMAAAQDFFARSFAEPERPPRRG